MLSKVVQRVASLMKSESERSETTKRNLLILVVVRGLSVGLSFAIIPLTINLVGVSEYGIWLALTSIIAWMSLFDVGLANGLRNKLSVAIAEGDFEHGRRLVSTAYALMAGIFIPLMLVLILLNYSMSWYSVLRVENGLANGLKEVASVLVVYFCLRLVISIANTVLLATHRAGVASISGILEQGALLVAVLLLIYMNMGGLLVLASAVCLTSLGSLAVFSVHVYKKQIPELMPKWSQVDFSLSREILGIGLKFFVIQLAGIIQFQTANLILIRAFGPGEVTEYNLAAKLFSVMPMAMTILLTPFWSAVSDAYAKGDYEWIHAATRKYKRTLGFVVAGGFLILVASSHIYRMWIRDPSLSIDFSLSLAMYGYCALTAYGAIYTMLLNGLGELRIQFFACLISPFVFLAVAYLTIDYFGLGVAGIVIASLLANFNAYVLAPWQTKRIFARLRVGGSKRVEV